MRDYVESVGCEPAPLKVYIAGTVSRGGTITDESEIRQNIARFSEVEEELRRQGYQPVNAVALHVNGNETVSTNYALWAMYLREDIVHLVGCDAIYKMPGWEHSRGARLEVHIARELGMVELNDAGL